MYATLLRAGRVQKNAAAGPTQRTVARTSSNYGGHNRRRRLTAASQCTARCLALRTRATRRAPAPMGSPCESRMPASSPSPARDCGGPQVPARRPPGVIPEGGRPPDTGAGLRPGTRSHGTAHVSTRTICGLSSAAEDRVTSPSTGLSRWGNHHRGNPGRGRPSVVAWLPAAATTDCWGGSRLRLQGTRPSRVRDVGGLLRRGLDGSATGQVEGRASSNAGERRAHFTRQPALGQGLRPSGDSELVRQAASGVGGAARHMGTSWGGPAQKQLSSIPFSKPKSRPSSSEMVPLACSRVKNPGRFPAATTVCWVASRACHTRTPAYGEARPTGRAPNLPRSAAVAARWAAAVVVRGGLRDAGAGPAPAAAGSTGSPTDAAVPGIAAGCRGAIAAAGSTTTCRTCPGSGWMTMHMGSGAEVAPWEVIGRWGCITGGE